MLAAYVLLLMGALLIASLVIGARWQESLNWSSSLVRYQLHLPSNLNVKAVSAWLSQVATMTTPPRFSLLPGLPIVVEIEATPAGIAHYVLVPKSRQVAFLASVRSALPGVRLEELSDEQVPEFGYATELRLSSTIYPLADERASSASAAVLAAMQPLATGAHVRIQWLLAGARSHRATEADHDALGWLVGAKPAERDALRARKLKHAAPTVFATARVAVASPTKAHGIALIHRLISSMRVVEAPGVHIFRRLLPSWLVINRVVARSMPLTNWPMLLNADEASGLLSLPLDGIQLPGLRLGAARQLPPSPNLPINGCIVGESNYPGLSRPIGLKLADRLRHTYILGPTGVGKSTLLANMALQDIQQGCGLVLIDPKADLVHDILARLPEDRLGDVVLLDPANTAYSIGFNPLASNGDEHARELTAETTVHILRDIFRAYWGPRTDDLLRAVLMTLTQVSAPNGDSFTLCEVPELLTNPELRRYVRQHGHLHQRWRDYWNWYEALSEGERLNAIGPVLNKLRAFTHRTSLRLMLGQSKGINIADVFTKRKILLVPLAKGQIGVEAAALLGSLIVGVLWQTTLARSVVPAEKRAPVFAYLDEFQDVVRLADDLGDMLAQARGLGLGVILAHQYLKQIPDATRAAVLGTARTQIAFQVEHDDARLLEKRFSPSLTASDLMGLSAYEIAMRPCVDSQTLSPVTARTVALPDQLRDAQDVASRLSTALGTRRDDIEVGLLARSRPQRTARTTRLGEMPSTGGQTP